MPRSKPAGLDDERPMIRYPLDWLLAVIDDPGAARVAAGDRGAVALARARAAPRVVESRLVAALG